MKVLSLEEIESIEARENYPDMNVVLSVEMTKLVHAAREYHRLREALWKISENDAAFGRSFDIAREALKESGK